MILDVINSGSKGNCYILHNNKEALVLECGEPVKMVTEILKGASMIKGCLITHEHGDHADYTKQYVMRGIPCYSTVGTATILADKGKGGGCIITLPIGAVKELGGFIVMPFRTFHDYPSVRAVEPCGYLISHEETGVVLFATDTHHIEGSFKELINIMRTNALSNEKLKDVAIDDYVSNIMIESNYKTSFLEKNFADGIIDKRRAERTIQTHFSLENCIETLKANDLSSVNNIVLLHLSQENANEYLFRGEVSKATNKKVYVAKKGLRLIDFNRIKE